MKTLTIKDAAVEALVKSNKPLSASEIYNHIVANGLYSFSAKNPLSILKIEMMRQCEGVEVSRPKAEKYFTQESEGVFWLKGVSLKSAVESVAAPKGTFRQADLDDLDVLAKVKAGDLNAFGVIYKKYRDVLFRKVMSRVNFDEDLANDLLMEAFEKAMVKCVDFKKDYTFNSWLSRLVDNHVIDYMRKRKLQTVSIDGMGADTEEGDGSIASECYLKSDTKNPEELKMAEESRDIVKSKIAKLDEMSQAVINLRYYQDKSYDEISAELNIANSNVKILLFRAKKKLEQMLQGSCVTA